MNITGAQTFCICGLGNPGQEYSRTRHNYGFLALDYLAESVPVQNNSFLKWRKSDLLQTNLGDKNLVLIKPLTFMNNSGEAVRETADYYRIPAEQCIIITDDSAIPFGTIRIKPSGSAGGHNGLSSVIQHIGSNFIRIRCGIGMPEDSRTDLKDFVLGRFTASEYSNLPAILRNITDAINIIIEKGPSHAMNIYNSKNFIASHQTNTVVKQL